MKPVLLGHEINKQDIVGLMELPLTFVLFTSFPNIVDFVRQRLK